MKNHMEYTYLSDFTIKGNGGLYGVCTAPNTRRLENYFQCILLLDPISKAFVKNV